jgi:phosphopantetheine adenylyltransferase
LSTRGRKANGFQKEWNSRAAEGENLGSPVFLNLKRNKEEQNIQQNRGKSFSREEVGSFIISSEEVVEALFIKSMRKEGGRNGR